MYKIILTLLFLLKPSFGYLSVSPTGLRASAGTPIITPDLIFGPSSTSLNFWVSPVLNVGPNLSLQDALNYATTTTELRGQKILINVPPGVHTIDCTTQPGAYIGNRDLEMDGEAGAIIEVVGFAFDVFQVVGGSLSLHQFEIQTGETLPNRVIHSLNVNNIISLNQVNITGPFVSCVTSRGGDVDLRDTICDGVRGQAIEIVQGKGALYMLTSYLGSTGNWVLEAGVEVSLAIENSVFVGTGGGILLKSSTMHFTGNLTATTCVSMERNSMFSGSGVFACSATGQAFEFDGSINTVDDSGVTYSNAAPWGTMAAASAAGKLGWHYLGSESRGYVHFNLGINPRSWSEVRFFCSSLGGALPTPKNVIVNSIINDLGVAQAFPLSGWTGDCVVGDWSTFKTLEGANLVIGTADQQILGLAGEPNCVPTPFGGGTEQDALLYSPAAGFIGLVDVFTDDVRPNQDVVCEFNV